MDNLSTPSPDASDTRSVPAAPDAKITVFILGHRDFSLDSIARMIENNGDRYQTFCIEPGDNAMAALATNRPDVLMIHNEIIDNPLERFIRDIHAKHPGIRLLVFGHDMDDEHLYRLVHAGVHGYINERMNGIHVERALNTVACGKKWIERHIMERFIHNGHESDTLMNARFLNKFDRLCDNLTARETEILREVIKGLAIKQIAEEVHLSSQGVKLHLARLFRKFGVRNRNQLILAVLDSISPLEDLSALLHDNLQRRLQPED